MTADGGPAGGTSRPSAERRAPGLAGAVEPTRATADGAGGDSGLVGEVEPASRRIALQAGLFAAFFAVAVVASGALVASVGGSPTEVLDALLDGSLRSPGAWGRTLVEMAPLALVGLGVVVAFRAGYYNIGTEGQVAMGALGAAVVVLKAPGPAWMLIVLGLAAGAAAGGFWAGLAAAAHARRRVDVLISTLLLTFVAPNVILFLVARDYLLLDTTEANTRRASQSERIPESTHLPDVELFGNTVHIGVPVAVAIIAAVAFLLARSVWGLKLRMLGRNLQTARRAGVRPSTVGGGALVISGAAAGLAGGMFLTGAAFRLQHMIANDFGWHGLLVALVARLNPAGVLPVAFFFASLRTGGGFLTATGISRTVTDVVQALFVVAALLPAAVMVVRDRRVARRLAQRSAAAEVR